MHYIVPIHYAQHACTLCNGLGYRLAPVSREDYPCSHIRYKRVHVAPEVLEREREAQEREDAAAQERFQALMAELLGEREARERRLEEYDCEQSAARYWADMDEL